MSTLWDQCGACQSELCDCSESDCALSHEEDAYRCDGCYTATCLNCRLSDCEWCEHMRGEQCYCPRCEGIVREFGQDICCSCFYFSGILGEEIGYCRDCDKVVFLPEETICACGRLLEVDHVVLIPLMQQRHPALKRFCKLLR